jgi:parallel beta-helix repeat protein
LAAASPALAHHVIHVHPGESIQAAIDKAEPGDTILVHPGTYKESVQIRKDDLTLRGFGHDRTVLAPPDGPPNNLCTQFFGPSGICILAKELSTTGDVVTPVVDDRVTGFTIQDFPVFGVVTFGSDDAQIDHNRALRNGAYGITSFNSTGSEFRFNLATGAGEAGFYYGDTPKAGGTIENNESYGNQFGIFIRNASSGTISNNNVHDNCAGLVFLAGAPGPVADWTARKNHFVHNDKACPAGQESPPVSGVGVYLGGTTHVTLTKNEALSNQPSGPTFVSGGIVVGTPGPGAPAPTDNLISRNSAFDNLEFDINYDGSGSGNQFVHNHCGTSSPPGLCS